jgi:hypothetical protein
MIKYVVFAVTKFASEKERKKERMEESGCVCKSATCPLPILHISCPSIPIAN